MMSLYYELSLLDGEVPAMVLQFYRDGDVLVTASQRYTKLNPDQLALLGEKIADHLDRQERS